MIFVKQNFCSRQQYLAPVKFSVGLLYISGLFTSNYCTVCFVKNNNRNDVLFYEFCEVCYQKNTIGPSFKIFCEVYICNGIEEC